ncbi:MAG: Rieske (2Fe-2S) protein, partial [Acidimicrobiaceae bacterium]|nr:Rieske (2Fe-2S) protein [Acidimicrobiaceae bacterium]
MNLNDRSIPELEAVAEGHSKDPLNSQSLHADAYVDPVWFDHEMRTIFARTWQWVCHGEKVREAGQYTTAVIAGMPIMVVRTHDDELKAFYNVCKHRAHELLQDEGTTRSIVCPYHAWTYDLGGGLVAARHTSHLPDFELGEICLDEVQVEEFGGFVYVNLDLTAPSLAEQAGDLGQEIAHWVPDID